MSLVPRGTGRGKTTQFLLVPTFKISIRVFSFQKVDMKTFFASIKCTIDGGYGQFGITPAPSIAPPAP